MKKKSSSKPTTDKPGQPITYEQLAALGKVVVAHYRDMRLKAKIKYVDRDARTLTLYTSTKHWAIVAFENVILEWE